METYGLLLAVVHGEIHRSNKFTNLWFDKLYWGHILWVFKWLSGWLEKFEIHFKADFDFNLCSHYNKYNDCISLFSSSSHISKPGAKKPPANTWRKVPLHQPPFWMISLILSLARATSLNKMHLLSLLLFLLSICSCQQQSPPPLLADDTLINDLVSISAASPKNRAGLGTTTG